MLKSSIDAKVFIEGVEVPAQSVSITHNMNTMSYASVNLPPIAEVPDIKARSLIHIGVRDQQSYGGDDYILMFVGETCEPSVTWSPSGFGLTITAYSLDNHWYAIPVYLQFASTESALTGEVPNISSPGAKKLAALCGTNIQFDIYGKGDSKITRSSQPSGKTYSENLAIPGMFTQLYDANSFWRVTGMRTGMSSSSRYYYYSDDIFAKAGMDQLVKKYVSKCVQAYCGRNAKFIEFFEVYKMARFASYALNHQWLNPHVMVTTGFEYIVPPACNVIFPHQFTRISTVGKNLSVGTRTIGVLTEAQVNMEDTLNRAAGSIRIFPKKLQPLVDAQAFDVLREIDPTSEEAWRGMVTNLITPNSFFMDCIAEYKGDGLEMLRKYFDYMISDEHVKKYNQNVSMIVPCSFVPHIQVGLPAVAFRPATTDKDNSSYTTVYGLVDSVQHSISASGVFSNVSLKDSKVISRNNVIPTPVPVWMDNMTIKEAGPVYKRMMGCNGTIDDAAGGTVSAFKQASASLAATALETLASFAAGIGVDAGNAADFVDIHKAIVEAIEIIGKNYDTMSTDQQRSDYAKMVVKRNYMTVQQALGSFTFEGSRADWVSQYKQLLVRENKIVATEEGKRILSGDNDVDRTSMADLHNEKSVQTVTPVGTTNVMSTGTDVKNPNPEKTAGDKVDMGNAVQGGEVHKNQVFNNREDALRDRTEIKVNKEVEEELTLNGQKYIGVKTTNGQVWVTGYRPGQGKGEGGLKGSRENMLTSVIQSSDADFKIPVSVAVPQASSNSGVVLMPFGTLFKLKGSNIVYRVDDVFGDQESGHRIDIATGGEKRDEYAVTHGSEIEYILRKVQ